MFFQEAGECARAATPGGQRLLQLSETVIQAEEFLETAKTRMDNFTARHKQSSCKFYTITLKSKA